MSTQLNTTIQKNFTKLFFYTTLTTVFHNSYTIFKNKKVFETLDNSTNVIQLSKLIRQNTIQNFPNTPENFTVLHSTLHNSTPLVKTIRNFTQCFNSFTKLYKAIQHFTKRHKTIHIYKQLYTTLQHFTQLYTTFTNTNTTTLYAILPNFSQLVKTQHNFIQLYTTLTPKISTTQYKTLHMLHNSYTSLAQLLQYSTHLQHSTTTLHKSTNYTSLYTTTRNCTTQLYSTVLFRFIHKYRQFYTHFTQIITTRQSYTQLCRTSKKHKHSSDLHTLLQHFTHSLHIFTQIYNI